MWRMEAEPWWPVAALALFQVADGIACAIPLDFLRSAFDRVRCSARVRQAIPAVKLASAAGLVAGLWWPPLGLVTGVALVAYFVVAIGFHVRARDTVVNSLAAVAMLAVVAAVTTCFT